jgi:uncharacterized protein YjbI with pentapeptide repeats
MLERKITNTYADRLTYLTIDCENCSGLCCVALFCAKTEGFPADKIGGKPCQNLRSDFRCKIHSKLVQSKMKGCLAYDCFGAGQKVTQKCYQNANWQTAPEQANQIFDVFLTIFQLHQMLWYLIEASSFNLGEIICTTIDELIHENEQMTELLPHEILNLDIEVYRLKVNGILKEVSKRIGAPSAKDGQIKDFFGKNFNGVNLDGKDFSMALMIAANLEGCSLKDTNFLGADMRDANIMNTDLSKSVFLTQMQINATKGNSKTKIPANLTYPIAW